jgi:hypothetical protein
VSNYYTIPETQRNYVACKRCGAVVARAFDQGRALELHDDFHAKVDDAARSASKSAPAASVCTHGW